MTEQQQAHIASDTLTVTGRMYPRRLLQMAGDHLSSAMIPIQFEVTVRTPPGTSPGDEASLQVARDVSSWTKEKFDGAYLWRRDDEDVRLFLKGLWGEDGTPPRNYATELEPTVSVIASEILYHGNVLCDAVPYSVVRVRVVEDDVVSSEATLIEPPGAMRVPASMTKEQVAEMFGGETEFEV